MGQEAPTFDWIRTLAPLLVKEDGIPQLGSPPPFPFDAFQKKWEETFGLKEFRVEPGPWEWVEQAQLLDGIGSPARTIAFALSPLEGEGWFIIGEQELRTLSSWLLGEDPIALTLPEVDYQEAFCRFILLEVIRLFQQIYPDKTIAPSLRSLSTSPTCDALTSTIELCHGTEKIPCKLALNPALRASWSAHFAKPPSIQEAPLPQQELPIELGLECSRVTLNPKTWRLLKEGDFLVLDRCSLSCNNDNASLNGQVYLTFKGFPLLVGELKENKVEITGYPVARVQE
jgi:flagellar motor switch protein FliN